MRPPLKRAVAHIAQRIRDNGIPALYTVLTSDVLNVGLCRLVYGGWISLKRDLVPLLGSDLHVLSEIVAACVYTGDTRVNSVYYRWPDWLVAQSPNLFQLLTDPRLKGSDGRRLTFQQLLPRGLSGDALEARWRVCWRPNGLFLTLFADGKLSFDGWMQRRPEEVVVWNMVEKEFPPPLYHSITGQSCFLQMIQGIVDHKRQIEPDTDVVLHPHSRLNPQFSSFRDPAAPAVLAQWIAQDLVFEDAATRTAREEAEALHPTDLFD